MDSSLRKKIWLWIPSWIVAAACYLKQSPANDDIVPCGFSANEQKQQKISKRINKFNGRFNWTDD